MAYDVGILGVGTMGSMALWQLAKRGVRSIGFEQFGLAHEAGAVGGETRIFRTAYREGRDYVSLLNEALRLWRELEADTAQSILDLNGFVTIGSRDDHYLSGVIDCMTDLDLDAEIMTGQELNARFPALNALPHETAVLDRAGGLLKPEKAVMAAGSFAEASGATLLRNCEVQRIEPSPSGVWVSTTRGDYRVGKLLVTAGAWSSRFLPPRLVRPHRVGLSWFLCKDPDLFSRDRFPSSNRMIGGTGISLFTSQDRTMVKAAVNGSLGEVGKPSDILSEGKPEAARLSAIVSEYYPMLWPEPVRSASYVDGFSPDEHAVVGELDDMPNVLVAAGFSAHGFKMASAIGAALADLAIDGKTALPTSHLAASRPVVSDHLASAARGRTLVHAGEGGAGR